MAEETQIKREYLLIVYPFQGMEVHCNYYFETYEDLNPKESIEIFDQDNRRELVEVKNLAFEFIEQEFKKTKQYKDFQSLVKFITTN